MADKERIALLISGSGTTMAAMITEWQRDERLRVRLDLAAVISSKSDAPGIGKAKDLGVPESDIVVVNSREHTNSDGSRNNDSFGNRLAEVFREKRVGRFIQTGWIPFTPSAITDEWEGFNQHPGDPTEFGKLHGRQVHAAVVYFSDHVDRQIETRAVAHRVLPGIDDGAVVVYESVPVLKIENEAGIQKEREGFMRRVESLKDAVLPVEHRVQIELLRQLAQGTERDLDLPPISLPNEQALLQNSKARAREIYKHG